MGLINYTNIENNVPATANMFNERFGQIVDELNGNLEGVNMKDGSIPLSKLAVDVFSRLYPIGSVYINATDSTNPATLLGFGTWEAFGKGRVMVGKADDGTFGSAGTELGTETETLTVAQMPAHSHSGSTNHTGDHTHGFTRDMVVTSGSGVHRSYTAGSGQQFAWNSAAGMSAAGGHSHTVTVGNQGGGEAHNNIQPSVVVYAWRRTG